MAADRNANAGRRAVSLVVAGGGANHHVMEHHVAIEAVIAQMRGALSRPLLLPDLADMARLSPFHFLRVFRNVTGLTPRDFLAAVRMEAAKRLLLTTRLSVTDICFEVGYSSVGTFITRFSRLVGVAPGTFRRLGERMVEAHIHPLREGSRAGNGEWGRVPAPAGGCVAGRIVGPPGTPSGIIFAAAFPQAAPHGEPAACTVLPGGPGPYRIRPLPDGRFHILACLLPWSDQPTAYLLPGDNVWVGGSRAAVPVTPAGAGNGVDIVLRPIRPTDPPILASSPFMLARRLVVTGPERTGSMRQRALAPGDRAIQKKPAGRLVW